MLNNKFTQTLGDHFIYSINVDFINKETRLILGKHPGVDSKGMYELIFTGIIWQDFDGFDFQNIFNALEVNNSFTHFLEVKSKYIEARKRYFPSGLLNAIEEDRTLQYYYFYPTAGLGGFVICRHADIILLDGMSRLK